jgi:dihydrofolate reductase
MTMVNRSLTSSSRCSSQCRDKLVHIMGGASIIQQALAAGLVDELFLHVAPVILNSGTRLFEHLGGPIQLERAEVIESRHATHLRYRILK